MGCFPLYCISVGNKWASSLPISYSDIEENRLIAALHADVEAVDGRAATGLLMGNEGAAAVGRYQRQDRIGAIDRFVGKIKPRIDLPQHAAREDADHDMRGLRLAVRSRHRTRLDGVEAVDAFLVGRRAAEAGEFRVWARFLAARMGVAALRVGLPDFDHGVVNRLTVAVENAAFDTDFLPRRVGRNQIVADSFLPAVVAVGIPVAAPLGRQAIGEKWADGLRSEEHTSE